MTTDDAQPRKASEDGLQYKRPIPMITHVSLCLFDGPLELTYPPDEVEPAGSIIV